VIWRVENGPLNGGWYLSELIETTMLVNLQVSLSWGIHLAIFCDNHFRSYSGNSVGNSPGR